MRYLRNQKVFLVLLLIVSMIILTACGQTAAPASKPAEQQTASGSKVTIEVFHADSLAGPMKELKKAFETKNPDITVNLTSGKSKDLAVRILNGDTCDVFAPSDPKVIKDSLMGKKIKGSDKDGAGWSVVFSANEMVIVTKKGNPLGIKQASDLAKPEVKFVRVASETDLATNRTLDFLKKATQAEGKGDLAQKIIDNAIKADSIPKTVEALKNGTANAGVIYYSAAVAEEQNLDIIRFPASVNISDQIRNAATIPGTAKQVAAATKFINLVLSPEGQEILKKTGQPPIVPPLKEGNVPADIK